MLKNCITLLLITTLLLTVGCNSQKHFGKNGDDDEVVEKVFIGACGGALTDKIKPDTEGYKKSQTPPSDADVADEGRKKLLQQQIQRSDGEARGS